MGYITIAQRKKEEEEERVKAITTPIDRGFTFQVPKSPFATTKTTTPTGLEPGPLIPRTNIFETLNRVTPVVYDRETKTIGLPAAQGLKTLLELPTNLLVKGVSVTANVFKEATNLWKSDWGKLKTPQDKLKFVASKFVAFQDINRKRLIQAAERFESDLNKADTPEEMLNFVMTRLPIISATQPLQKIGGTLTAAQKAAALRVPTVKSGIVSSQTVPTAGIQPIAQVVSRASIKVLPQVARQLAPKPSVEVPKVIPKELQPLAEEAKKYKSAEEFVEALDEGRRGLHVEHTPLKRLTADIPENTPISKFIGEKEITVYRGIDDISGKAKREIGDGDFVATSIELAKSYTGDPENVVSKIVKAKDVYIDESDFIPSDFKRGIEDLHIEAVYNSNKPLTKSQLTDIYNQVVKEGKKGAKKVQKFTPPLIPRAIEKPSILPKSRVKPTIREVTGQFRPGEKIEISEDKLLKMVLGGKQQAAKVAFREGKKTGIFQAKENFGEVVARAKARKELSGVISELKTTIKRADLKHLRPERKTNVESILSQLDLTKMTGKTEQKLISRLHFIRKNPENLLPESKIQELERLDKKPVADLKKEDIELIRDAIRHEISLNKLKNKLIFGKKHVDAEKISVEARANVNKKPTPTSPDADLIDTSIKEKEAGTLKKVVTVDSYNPELITEILDRERRGVIKETLYGGIDKGVTKALEVQQSVMDKLRNQLEGIDVLKWSKHFQVKAKNIDWQTIKLPSGRTIKLSKGERISFMLHAKNPSNRAHLLEGGFRQETNLIKKEGMTADDLRAIIESATPEEFKVAKAFHEILNKDIKKEINTVAVDLNGFDIARETDYFPIRTVQLDRIRDALKGKQNITQATLEGMGILKERTNAKNALVIEDAFRVVYSHIKKTSSYVGLAQPLRNAKMLLFDNRFASAVRQNYGKEYLDSLEDYLLAIEANAHNLENVDRLTANLMNKIDVAILGGANIFVMLKQPVSYLIASTEMQPKYLKKASVSKVNLDEIRENSPQLRDRLDGNVTREMGELAQVGAVKKYFTGKSPISRKLMVGISKFDTATIGRIWNATKLEIADKFSSLKGDAFMKKVTERAEEVVRLTQPTFAIKDRSAIGRSRSLATRLLTKFSSQRNKNFNAIRRAILRYDTSSKTTKDKSTLVAKLMIITVVSSLMIEGINQLRRKVFGKDLDTLMGIAVNTFGSMLSNVYFLGDLFSSLKSKVTSGTFLGWDLSNPVGSFLNKGIDAGAEIINTTSQLIGKERFVNGDKAGELKWKSSIIKAMDYSASTALSLRGIPYESTKNLLLAPFRWAEPKESPTKKEPFTRSKSGSKRKPFTR